jgi:hypothetical protein
MNMLKTIWEEFVGLFVDDLSFAAAIAVWLVAAFFLAHTSLLPPNWRGPMVFFGLAVIFVENTLRRARK